MAREQGGASGNQSPPPRVWLGCFSWVALGFAVVRLGREWGGREKERDEGANCPTRTRSAVWSRREKKCKSEMQQENALCMSCKCGSAAPMPKAIANDDLTGS